MTYYKLIRDSTIIGVGSTADLRKRQEKHNILVRCSENEAQYIMLEDILYHDIWMQTPSVTELFHYEDADINAISEEEYNELTEAIASGDVIVNETETVTGEPIEEEETIFIPEEGDVTADYLKKAKIKELSNACNKAITDGFDIVLSDDKSHHFSLTLQDQTNLTSCYMQILSGAEEVPYHADGEEMVMFSASEMRNIIGAANEHKMYHLAYFNSAKKWVKALRKCTTISAVNYGDEIPEKYQSDVYKSMKHTE